MTSVRVLCSLVPRFYRDSIKAQPEKAEILTVFSKKKSNLKNTKGTRFALRDHSIINFCCGRHYTEHFTNHFLNPIWRLLVPSEV